MSAIRKPPAANTTTAGDASVSPEESFPEPTITVPEKDGPTIAATVEEVSKPWSAKRFTFIKPITHERVDAIVIRLPDRVLWSFSLREPYGQCKLEYVTDLNRLVSEFDFPASHPMVVNPCNQTIYDPLKIGPVGGDVWVRGQIVHGVGLRPPMSIEVEAKIHSIIATRIEQ